MDVWGKIRVVDSETTGLDTDPAARLVEAAWCDVTLPGLEIGEAHSRFANPEIHIPAEASAVHHIVDADVAMAQSIATVRSIVLLGTERGTVFAAHNAKFDRHFLPTPDGYAWICTYKCAKRIYRDAPKHSNQVLRYHLGLPVDPAKAMPPHRAAADVHVTTHLLVHMLQRATLDELILWSSQPAYQPTCEFGKKHKGAQWKDVPTDYLRWMAHEADQIDQDTKDNALLHLKSRGW